jgi:hypothetical protein
MAGFFMPFAVEQAVLPPSPRDELLRTQNQDGGWGYHGNVSWTEPTAFAVLALFPEPATAMSSAVRWLKSMQRPDGGWRPTTAVDESTWVTAVAMLALRKAGALPADDRSVTWLLQQTGRESSWTVRLRQLLLGSAPDHSTNDAGWPWFPGTAGWVMPTAFSILALRALQGARPELRGRASEGQRFLLSRQCADGGWNHGSSRALGYEGLSYPETTGISLLALSGGDAPVPANALRCAEQHLARRPSASGANWLQLGLAAAGKLPEGAAVHRPSGRNVSDVAIARILEQAVGGHNAFLR